MSTFVQTTSIAKQFYAAIAMTILLFILGFSGVYLSNQNLLVGLSQVHEAQSFSNILSQLIQIDESIPPLIEKSNSSLKSAESSRRVFETVYNQLTTQFRKARTVSRPNPEYDFYLNQALVSFQTINKLARRYLSDRLPFEATRDLLLIKQYTLEAAESLRKLKLVNDEISERIFESLYQERYQPMIVGIFLMLLSVTLVLWRGLPLIWNLGRSLAVLIHATEEVGRGDLGLQAPVLTADEVGVLASAFNQMTNTLKRVEVEKRAVDESRKVIAELTNSLSKSIDYRTTLEQVVQFFVPRLACCCIVQILGEDGQVGMVDLACPKKEPQVRNWVNEHRSLLCTDAFEDLLAKLDVPSSESNDLSYSYMKSALKYQDRTLGAIFVTAFEQGKTYHANDLTLFSELVPRISIAVENARLYHEAQESLLSRDEFLSIASHELKTPLTSLSLQLQVLVWELRKRSSSQGGKSESENKDMICIPKKIVEIVFSSEIQCQKLSKLLDQLLDLTRIRLGKFNLTREIVDLGNLVNQVLARFKFEISESGISVSTQCTPSVIGFWDPMRMEQVISNLISNAIKYGNRKPVLVVVELDQVGNSARLIVEDHGMGIPIEMQQKIFERFERAGMCGAKIPGLGLGLYICWQIVQAHGGSIRVSSEMGKGSVFTVELPLSKPNAV